MPNRWPAPIAFLLFVTTAAACGSPSTSEQTAAPSAALEACRALGAASLGYTRRCSGTTVFPRDAEHARDTATLCEGSLAARGTTTDAAAVRACADALDTTPCEGPPPDACRLAPGALVDGTPCLSGLQCVSQHCEVGPAGGCGRCARPGPSATCEPWLVGTAAACGGETCMWSFDGAGPVARCGSERGPVAGESCTEGGGCARGYTCRRGASGAGVCERGHGRGEQCDQAARESCGVGLECVDGKCGSRGKDGERCEGYGLADIAFDTCEGALACDADTKQCAAITLVATGGTCDDATLRCERGYCQHDGARSGTCVAKKRLGDACDPADTRDRCEGLARCVEGSCRLPSADACR